MKPKTPPASPRGLARSSSILTAGTVRLPMSLGIRMGWSTPTTNTSRSSDGHRRPSRDDGVAVEARRGAASRPGDRGGRAALGHYTVMVMGRARRRHGHERDGDDTHAARHGDDAGG